MKPKLLITLAAAMLIAAGYAFYYLRSGMDAAEVVRKLAGLRLSAEFYRQDHDKMPASFADTLRAGNLEAAPGLKLRWHLKSSSVRDTPSLIIKNTGGWAYVNAPKDPAFGLVYIDSSDKDEKGRFWSEF